MFSTWQIWWEYELEKQKVLSTSKIWRRKQILHIATVMKKRDFLRLATLNKNINLEEEKKFHLTNLWWKNIFSTLQLLWRRQKFSTLQLLWRKKILHLAIILKRYFLHLATLTGKKLPPRPPRTLPLCSDSDLMMITKITLGYNDMTMMLVMMMMIMMMTMMQSRQISNLAKIKHTLFFLSNIQPVSIPLPLCLLICLFVLLFIVFCFLFPNLILTYPPSLPA